MLTVRPTPRRQRAASSTAGLALAASRSSRALLQRGRFWEAAIRTVTTPNPLPVTNDQTRNHTTMTNSHRPGRPAYFLGRPASMWIDATSRRQQSKHR